MGQIIKVKLGNKDTFNVINDADALSMFVEIFGEESRHIGLQFVRR